MFFGNEENVRTVAFYSRGVTGRMVRKGGGQVRLGFILEIIFRAYKEFCVRILHHYLFKENS